MNSWNCNAPQWLDFNNSTMSDIDEFFNVEHREHEHRCLENSHYDSFSDSPDSKPSTPISVYNTPKSNRTSRGNNSGRTDETLSTALTNLSLRSSKKSLQNARMSMTPIAMKRVKAAMSNENSPIVRAATKSEKREENISEEKEDKPTVAENLEAKMTDEGSANCTLVANDEEDKNVSVVKKDENPREAVEGISALPEEKLKDDKQILIDDNSSETKLDSYENPIIEEEKIENDIIEVPIVEEEKIEIKINDVATVSSPFYSDMFSKPKLEENNKSEEISAEERSKLAEMVAKLDPAKRPIVEKNNQTATSSQVVTDNAAKRPIIDNKKTATSRTAQKVRVLTSQARRQSVSKYRRRSNKYVSLAEAVSKFQNGTPTRFRSTKRKDDKAGPLQKVKQTAMKLTTPMSPLLRCKLRARTNAIPSAEEREKLQIEEIRKNRVRPNPIKPKVVNNVQEPSRIQRTQSAPLAGNKNKSSLPRTLKPKTTNSAPSAKFNNAAASSKVPPQKLATASSTSSLKTFAHSSRFSTKPTATVTSAELKTCMDPPKAVPKIDKKVSEYLQTTFGDHSKSLLNPGSSATLKTTPMKNSHNISSKKTPCKVMIQAVDSSSEIGVIKNVEILHFGIPIDNSYKNKNITRPVPFSFDSQNRKDKKKDPNQHEGEKTGKSIFHAKPPPSFVKSATTSESACKTSHSTAPDAETKDEKTSKSLLPLSFQERNELLLQKKKKKLEEIAEKEKQARVFHAKPAPNFKPVFVRGNSAENLRAHVDHGSGANNKPKSRGLSPASRQKGLSQEMIASNQENKEPNLPADQQNKESKVSANQQFPKLKNPLMSQNLKIKKTAGK